MRKDWEVKKLRDVCNIEYGFPFNSRLFVDDSTFMPLIRIRDLKTCSPVTFYTGEYDVNYIVHKGDYLIGMDGEFNIVEWKGDNGLLNQRICRIRSSVKELLNQFLLSYLPIPLKKIEDATPFVTVKHLSATKINNIDIPVPPIQIQQHIVEELDCLTSIIEKQKKQLEELDNLAQSIFYDMFGDPIENNKGWEVKTFKEICNSDLGKTLNKSKDVGVLHPYLCSINIQWNKVDLSLLKEACFEENEILKYVVYKGDLLVCEGGDIGRAAIWQEDYPMLYQNALHRIRFKDNVIAIYGLYFLWALKKKGILDTRYAKGVTIKHLVKAALLSIKISVPPLPLQQQFAAKIEAIEKQKELIKKSIKETEDLFNSRMDYYFN